MARGSLIVIYPGVYRVGHAAPSVEATYLAAVRACGEGALLMGPAAAFLYGLIKGRPPGPVVKTRTERRIEGIETHRTRSRPPGTEWKGIPVTTVPATLVGLAPAMPEAALARAVHEAQVRFRIELPQAMPKKLRRIIEGHVPVTLSELEARLLTLLAENELPRPITTEKQEPTASIAAGPPTTSRSNSTATATTTPVTRGSRTAAASARRTPAETSTAATPTATSSRTHG